MAQIRNIGSVDRSALLFDNDWEEVKRGGKSSISNWIDNQMLGCSCTVVLIGSETSQRPWVLEEIKKSWHRKKGVVGIHIHGLKDKQGNVSVKGENPFELLSFDGGKSPIKLSDVVKCYDPQGYTSKERYDWIAKYLSSAVEEAIKIRNLH